MVGQVPWDFLNMKTKEHFVRHANEVMAQGMIEHPTRPFQVNGANGPIIILPRLFAEEIRHDPRLSFTGVIEHNFFPSYAGLEIFSPIGPGNDILQEVVRKHLTLSLDALTPSLSDEMGHAVATLLTPRATTKDGGKEEDEGWRRVKFFHIAPELTARVSSRAFLGAPLCRDARWLDVSVRYTVDSFFAVRALRVVPPVLRPLAQHVLPEMRVVRDEQAMTLSDGTHLPRGALLGIPTITMRDPSGRWGPSAARFVGDRFLRLREEQQQSSTGGSNRWQFVSTSADHMGFGYGRQACPGRFFAAAQIKVSIVHLLLNFDWRWEEGKGQPQSVIQSEHIPDPEAEILFRRRTPEIELL
ncbi:putative cytochrome p450 [Diplodia seriata]|uniref:Putative cytochrome p450 n=1 Tax=Diplodia seriata TaxID=420778 RepID=A0A0G2DQT9_9PEZI|nr:putative cytochrome p450 [Diplodia seriata]